MNFKSENVKTILKSMYLHCLQVRFLKEEVFFEKFSKSCKNFLEIWLFIDQYSMNIIHRTSLSKVCILDESIGFSIGNHCATTRMR